MERMLCLMRLLVGNVNYSIDELAEKLIYFSPEEAYIV